MINMICFVHPVSNAFYLLSRSNIYPRKGKPTKLEVITIRIQVAKQIRYLRQQHQWTQQYLAENCLLPGLWSLSRLEARGTDSLSTLQIICEAFGIEVWELLRDASNQPN